MNQTQKFCPLPWINLSIRDDGDIRVCSQSHTSTSKGLLHKSDGSIYNAGMDSLEEAYNSEDLKSLRLSMLNNTDHPICTRCDKEEANGIRSRRNLETNNWAEQFSVQTAKSLTAPDGSANQLPMYYDMRFGNKCNLKCRSCSPTDSSFWYEDYQKLWSRDSFHNGTTLINFKREGARLVEDTDKYRWYENSQFWDQMYERLKNTQHIHTVGGEPLLINQHFDLLEKCIELNVAHQITIEYNSNITIIPERAWRLWGRFKRVSIGASVDGVGMVNDYIRHPSKFENIYQNLLKIDSSSDNIHCWIANTVQVYNAHHLPELIKWIIQKRFKKVQRFLDTPVITCHPLHNPAFLSTKILPKPVKEWIGQLYAECNVWLEENAQMYMDEEWASATIEKVRILLNSYENHMNSEDWSHLLPKFFKYSDGLDLIRKESFQNSIPDLWEKLHPFHEA